ncbi:MAG TPA: single-stranded DNA-binding protein [Pseudomonadota bacterium]|jgi:single-strand DNA-binding protein|nr:single-stranded DNA-binding protein [Pseudomonadota bacterium]
MAGSVNKVIVIGHLGANPEVKYLPSGQPVCELRVATSETYRDRNEQPVERTEWHRIVTWGKTAENCGKYLQKGRQVYVEGRLQTRSWDDKEGKKQYTTEIVAQSVVFLGGGGGAGREEGARESSHSPPYGGGSSGSGRYARSAPSSSAEPPLSANEPSSGGDFGAEDDIPF